MDLNQEAESWWHPDREESREPPKQDRVKKQLHPHAQGCKGSKQEVEQSSEDLFTFLWFKSHPHGDLRAVE